MFLPVYRIKIHQIALSQSAYAQRVLFVFQCFMFDAEHNAWLRYANGYAGYWKRSCFWLWLRKLLHGPRVEDLSWHIPNHNFGSITCSLIHDVRLCMCLHMCVWHTLHMYVFQAVRCTHCHLGSRGPLNQQSGFRNRRHKTARDSIRVVDTGTGACGRSAAASPNPLGYSSHVLRP